MAKSHLDTLFGPERPPRDGREILAALQKAAGTERRDALRSAQRAWLAYDKAQDLWVATLHADEGTSAALNVGGAALQRRRARVCDLMNDLEGL